MNKFTGNTLKLFALVCMTIDHVGMMFFSSNVIFKIIGRLSYPVFAYMISEGWKYTSNRKRYISLIWLMGLVYQVFYYIFFSSLYMGIFITYGLSLFFIWAIEYFVDNGKSSYLISPLILVCVVFVGCIEYIFPYSGFSIDYGLVGIIIPVLVYFNKTKKEKISFLFLGLCCLSLIYKGVQFVSLLSVPLLCFYNGKRGNKNLKYLFYIYYPAHLVVIWLINLLV